MNFAEAERARYLSSPVMLSPDTLRQHSGQRGIIVNVHDMPSRGVTEVEVVWDGDEGDYSIWYDADVIELVKELQPRATNFARRGPRKMRI